MMKTFRQPGKTAAVLWTGILLLLTVSLLPADTPAGTESPYEYSVRFSDTAKFSGFSLEHNIIDTFEFEGTVHWTEYTELNARLKIDNWSDSVGSMLFGGLVDQRYGMNYPVILDRIHIRSSVLDEAGITAPVSLSLLGGYNAGGVLNREWTVFNFENYRLAGIEGAVFQTDLGVYEGLYITGAFNPAFGSDNLIWSGLCGAVSEHPDILLGASWRSGEWWTEIYWDSYANSSSDREGSDLTVLGAAGYGQFDIPGGYRIRVFDRLEYGIPLDGDSEQHLRCGAAAGVTLPLLKGLETNLSLNGYFLDRQELNLGWDSELMVTETFGVILALGGIRLADDPAFVYEAGLSGRYSFLSLFFGYSDHKGGNEGWFSGAFDTTPDSEGGIFLRLEVVY